MNVSRAVVEHVLEHVADGALVVDADGVVVYANRDAERIFARSRTDIAGVGVATLFAGAPLDWATPGRHAWDANRSDGSSLAIRAAVSTIADHVVITLQDRANVGPAPQVPDPAGEPDRCS